jgi:hypothetical protein
VSEGFRSNRNLLGAGVIRDAEGSNRSSRLHNSGSRLFRFAGVTGGEVAIDGERLAEGLAGVGEASGIGVEVSGLLSVLARLGR